MDLIVLFSVAALILIKDNLIGCIWTQNAALCTQKPLFIIVPSEMIEIIFAHLFVIQNID